MIDLSPSRRFSIAKAVEAAVVAGARLNAPELILAIADWESHETDDTVRYVLDCILKQQRKAAA